MLLVVLQEGAAGETAPATPSGPPAASLPPPGPACPEGSLFSRPGHYRPHPPFPPILPPRHCACTFPLSGSPQLPLQVPTHLYCFSSELPFPCLPKLHPHSFLCPQISPPGPSPQRRSQTWLAPGWSRPNPSSPTHPTLWATGLIDSWETKTWQAKRLSRGCFVMKPK